MEERQLKGTEGLGTWGRRAPSVLVTLFLFLNQVLPRARSTFMAISPELLTKIWGESCLHTHTHTPN